MDREIVAECHLTFADCGRGQIDIALRSLFAGILTRSLAPDRLFRSILCLFFVIGVHVHGLGILCFIGGAANVRQHRFRGARCRGLIGGIGGSVGIR